jgi:Ca-activated chloride channel family protein
MSTHSQWQDHLPRAVIEALRVRKSNSATFSQWAWLISWTLISLSAAGPSWLKQPVPVIQNQNATIIVLDLSQSMLANDLTPDRLTLAKYKLIDVLRSSAGKDLTSKQSADGQFALIAYSGDAYTVSPLTDDPKTIEALLPALLPNIMPSIGSNVEAAITLANNLFSDAGINSGQILLLTDGVAESAFDNIEKTLSSKHSLSILGVGSNEATPVPLPGGGFMRKSNGEILLASLNAQGLQKLAITLGGNFAQISSTESDINFLLNKQSWLGGNSDVNEQLEEENSFDAWIDMGHWLLVLLLPIFLLLFRKGLVYTLPIVSLSLLVSPTESYAASRWDKLWKTPDQIGTELIQNDKYEAAAETFNSKDWSAVARYKNAEYEKTIELLKGKNDIGSLYNRANALALTGKFDEAIDLYKETIEIDQGHTDAKHNLALLEQLKRQQEEQQKQEGESEEQDSEQQGSEQQGSESQQGDSSERSNDEESQVGEQEPKESSDDTEQKDASSDEESEAQKEQEASEKTEDQEEKSEQEKSVAEQQAEEKAEEQSDTEEESALVQSPDPLKDSSEQWLRSIQDDPSGLLRRKFEYQARERQQQGNPTRQKKDDSGQQRY